MKTSRATTVVEGEDGVVRALILQSTQAQLGPVRIGVMSARRTEPGQAPRARLRLALPDGVTEQEVGAGEVIELGPHGQLGIAEVHPQSVDARGPETPTAARGHVMVAWRPRPEGAPQS